MSNKNVSKNSHNFQNLIKNEEIFDLVNQIDPMEIERPFGLEKDDFFQEVNLQKQMKLSIVSGVVFITPKK